MRPGFQRRRITHAVTAVCKKLVSILSLPKHRSESTNSIRMIRILSLLSFRHREGSGRTTRNLPINEAKVSNKFSVLSSKYSVKHNPLSVILSRWSKKAKNPVTTKKDGILQSLSLHQDDNKKGMILKEKLAKLFSVSSYTGKKKIDKQIDQAVGELKQKTAEIAAIDARIIRLQQSGKTTFRSMNKIHVYLTMRSKSYHKLHTLKYSSHFNLSALIIFVLSAAFAISSNYSNWMGPILPKRLAAVDFIHASAPEDTSIYTGESNSLKIGYSNKEAKTVGINAISKSDRIPNADQYQLSMNLLSDGLNIPEENKLGYQQDSKSAGKQVSWYWEPAQSSTNSSRSVILSKAKNPIINGILQFLQDDTKKANAQEEPTDDNGVVTPTENEATSSDAVPLEAPERSGVISAEEGIHDATTAGSQIESGMTEQGSINAQPTTNNEQPTTSSQPTTNNQELTTNSQLPTTTVVAREVQAPGPEDVIYDISDKITVRYHMEEHKVKEYIIVKDKDALTGNTLNFSMNSQGLTFRKDQHVDGAWRAYREEDKGKQDNEAYAVFRISKPVVNDSAKKPGTISLDIKESPTTPNPSSGRRGENAADTPPFQGGARGGYLATYTIDPVFLTNASYPIIIDPDITDTSITRTWDGEGTDVICGAGKASNWDCAKNWTGDTVPVAGDDVVFDSTSYDPAIAAPGSGTAGTINDDINSITLNGLNWDGGGKDIQASAVDAIHHFAYFGTNEAPGRVIKVNTQTNKVVNVLKLNTGEDYLNAGVVDASGNFAYFVTHTSPGKLIKIQLSDFTRTSTVDLLSADSYPLALTLNGDGSYGFVSTEGGKVVRISLSGTPSRIGVYSTGGSYLRAAISDGTYGYFAGQNQTYIYKINLTSDPNPTLETAYNSGEAGLFSAVYDGSTGYGYFVTTDSSAKIAKIHLPDLVKDGSSFQTTGARYVYSVAIDSNGNLYLPNTYINARIVKVATTPSMSQTGSYSTTSFGRNVVVDGGNAYIGSMAYGNGTTLEVDFAKLSVMDLASFTYTKSIDLGYSLMLQKHSVISNDGNNYKLDLETLTLNSGEIDFDGDTSVNPDPTLGGCGTYNCGRGMEINANTITIASGSRISASGRGFAGGNGPSKTAGSSYAGGGYGGRGGNSATGTRLGGTTYGSVTVPISLGSGSSGDTNSGAGALKLSISGSGTLTNNGTISAEGFAQARGGGSGGSVYLDVTNGTFAGSGTINVNGVIPQGYGAGGGGRIAVYMTTDNYSGSGGTMTAYGGVSSADAGGSAGTIYTKLTSQTNGTLTIDNNNQVIGTPYNGILPSALLPAKASAYIFDTVALKGKAILEVGTGSSLDLSSNTFTTDTSGVYLIHSAGTLTLPSTYTLTNLILQESTSSISGLQTLIIDSGGVLTHAVNSSATTATTEPNLFKMNFSVPNLTINSGGSVNADAKGYPVGQGLGAAGNWSGGGYGGIGGGNAGGAKYGSATSPTDLGSGGYGGTAYGGGAIKLTVSGTLAINGTGTVSANGQTNQNGSASGGSVWIIANSLSGNGTISANGGNYNNVTTNIGGGGRIVVSVSDPSCTAFSGSISASGGGQARAGTIILPSCLMGDSGDLVLDDTGDNMSTLTLGNDTAYNFRNITIGNGGSLYLDGDPKSDTGVSITVLNNVTVSGTGKINADYRGFPGLQGPGTVVGNWSGAGYGGKGGNGGGGPTYGSSTMPVNLGSGGYNTSYGGGAIKLTVNGELAINGGSISANGQSNENGAGSGGSIFIITTNLSGSGGSITANGGSGSACGGGGGGRIAIYIKGEDGYSGTKTANAGSGGIPAAGAGTVYVQHFPQVTNLTPVTESGYAHKRPVINFTATDADAGDYWRPKLEVSTTSNFASNNCIITQTAATPAGELSGDCAAMGIAGSFSNMNGGPGSNTAYLTNRTGSFTFSSDLPQSQTYYTRISAADPEGAAGILGSSGLLYTGGQYSNIPTSSSLNALPITIEAYVKTTTFDVAERGIVNKYTSGSYNGYNIFLASGRPYAWYYSSGSGVSSLQGSRIDDGLWHHIVFTVDNSGGKLFVDGVQKASGGWTGTYAATTTSQPLSFGRYDTSYFMGQIDEVRISNSARYPSNFTPPTAPFDNDPNTVGLWHMDDATGQTVLDSSSNHYDGTLGANSSIGTDDPSWADGAVPNGVDPTASLWTQTVASGTQTFTVAPFKYLYFNASGGCENQAFANQTVHAAPVIHTIQACDVFNDPVVISSSAATRVDLASTNTGTHNFSESPTGTPTVTYVNIAAGQTSKTFYYYDEHQTGIPTPATITAVENPAITSPEVVEDALATQAVINAVPHHITLALDSHSPGDQIPAGENLTARLVAQDQYGNPAKDSPNNFTGDHAVTFTGATASSSGCTSNSNTNPTVRDKDNANIPFGTATTLNFGTADAAGGGQASGVMILKMVEGTQLLPINLVTSSAYGEGSINNQTAPASPYTLSVIPGDLNHLDADPTSYPRYNTAQYVISEEDWATSGPRPYYPKVTVKDIYCNTKTNYDGPVWFSTEEVVPSTFGRNEAEPYTFVPATDNGIHTFNDYTNADTFKISTGGDDLIVHISGKNDADNTITSDIHVRVKGRGIDYLGLTFDTPIVGQDIDENLRSNVTVSAYDAKGNSQFDYTGLIYFTSTDPTAELPCTLNNQPEDKCLFGGITGELHFTADQFKFHTGGNHTITAHDDVTLKSSSTDHLAPAISAVTVVKPHTVSGLTATAGYQSINLFWNNPADTLAKVHIYKKIGDGGSFALADEPTIIPGSATTSYQVKYLQNGTKYYFKIKGVIINTATGDEVESTAYSNSDGAVFAIPQDIGLREPQFLTQDSQGRIAATYKTRWNSNISVEYQLPGTTTWTAASAAAVTGDTLGLSGNESLVSHTTYFTPATDIPDRYYLQGQGFRVRLRVDAEGSYVYEESSAVFADTRLPHVNANESFIIMDVTGTNTATLTLNAREDGTPEQKIWYRLSNSETDIENQLWQVFYDPASPAMRPTQVVGWNLGTDTNVYVQFKDPYNNISKSGTAVLDTPASFALKDGSNIDTEKYRLVLIWDDVTVANFSKYVVDRSSDAVNWEVSHDVSTKNGYLDVNLNSGQKYYYRVKTQDAYGNVSRPTAVLMSQPGAAPDVTAKPTITMQNWKQEYGVRATVTWDTDQSADSFVVYSKKPLQSGSATLTTDGEAAQVVGQFDKTLNHSVLVQQLEPSTKYYFKTLSQNEIKITGASEIVEMETPARVPLVLSGVEFTNTTNTGTTVSWSTNKLSTTKLEYGTDASYGKSIEDKNQNTDHIIPITNLASGATYHIRITSTDVDGNYVTSDDYKVLIPATPTVDNIKIEEVRSSQATIKWRSNVPADSRVQFSLNAIASDSTAISASSESSSAPSGTTADSPTANAVSEQGQSDFVSTHAVTIIGLESAKTYHYRVKSTDQFGNTAISEDKTFTTPADTTPPAIKNAKSEITTTGTGDTMKIMAIISWETDEPATSQVAYGQGLSSEYPNKTDEVTTFNMTHTVIIPDLRPNASYQYQIIAKDASGNLTKGDDLTLITPPKDKSLLQMVLKSLEETFSWVKRLPESPIIRKFHR